jgi:hypothetical protein
MLEQLDPRIIRVTLQVNNQIYNYETQTELNSAGQVLRTNGLWITARGTKFDNENPQECEVSISGLSRETREFLLSETSPWNANRVAKQITVSAGRVSTGLSLIYSGDVVKASITNPPDNIVTLNCLTFFFQNGNIITPAAVPTNLISNIAKQVAGNLGIPLQFEATDKPLTNYNFIGAALKQIDRINSIGGVSAYIENNVLVVKNKNTALVSAGTKIVSAETGMVALPEITNFGVKVTFMIDNYTRLGTLLTVKSDRVPTANGSYIVYKLAFDISSRDNNFYWVAEAQRNGVIL